MNMMIADKRYKANFLQEETFMETDTTIAKSLMKEKGETGFNKLLRYIKSKKATPAEKANHKIRLNKVKRDQEKAREFFHYNTFNRG